MHIDCGVVLWINNIKLVANKLISTKNHFNVPITIRRTHSFTLYTGYTHARTYTHTHNPPNEIITWHPIFVLVQIAHAHVFFSVTDRSVQVRDKPSAVCMSHAGFVRFIRTSVFSVHKHPRIPIRTLKLLHHVSERLPLFFFY